MAEAETPASTGATSTGLAAEIITTGSEILLGEIVDTNAAWIAQQLRDAGVNLYFKTTVGDNEARVRSVLELSLSRSDVLIVTGGLGPTADDITRHAIAAATHRPLVLDPGALETLAARFERFGVQMTDNNRQQALIPEGAILIENPVGTAPGFIVEDERGVVIALPGVPREMKHLMAETVLPYLRKLSGDTGVIVRRVLRTVGIGESSIDHRISDLMQASNPSVGLAAHTGQADVRITARAEKRADADALLDQIESEIRTRIGEFIYSTTPEESVETVVAAALAQANATVALLETNTQGAVARRLSAGVTAGADNPVIARWDVTHDPAPLPLGDLWGQIKASHVADETLATLAATRLLAHSSADYALAILGAAGEDQGVYGRTRGETWFALADARGVVTALARYGGSDEFTTVRLGNQALALLWNRLLAS